MEQSPIDRLRELRAEQREQYREGEREFIDTINEIGLTLFHETLDAFLRAASESNYATANIATIDTKDYLVYPMFTVYPGDYTNDGYINYRGAPVSTLIDASGAVSFIHEAEYSRYPSYYSSEDPEKYPEEDKGPIHFHMPRTLDEIKTHNSDAAIPDTFRHMHAYLLTEWASFLLSHMEFMQNESIAWSDSLHFDKPRRQIYKNLVEEHFPEGLVWRGQTLNTTK